MLICILNDVIYPAVCRHGRVFYVLSLHVSLLCMDAMDISNCLRKAVSCQQLVMRCFAVLCAVLPAFCADGQGVPRVKESVIGLGWAATSVNVAVFRKHSLATHKDVQYAAYYDSVGYVVLARRKLNEYTWAVKRTPYRGNVRDAHNIISLAVDGSGYLHLAWDHHNDSLRYCRSIAPGSLELTEKLPMTKRETRITYPEFYSLPGGDLLFFFRDGESGQGNLVINRYDLRTKQWWRVHDVVIDGEGQRNAYWQAYADGKGRIHLSWVWRESSDVASNHDLCYAVSDDAGVTWRRSTGERYTLPITQASAEYAWRIPQQHELINQTSLTADAAGNPFIATYWRFAADSVPQYRIVYHDRNGWHLGNVSQRTTPFTLRGGGTKRIPISRPQVVVNKAGMVSVIYRDAERGDRVSLSTCRDMGRDVWTTVDLATENVGAWEPTFDVDLWRRRGLLHLFVQRAGQGDGERTEAVPAQPVRVLECSFD